MRFHTRHLLIVLAIGAVVAWLLRPNVQAVADGSFDLNVTISPASAKGVQQVSYQAVHTTDSVDVVLEQLPDRLPDWLHREVGRTVVVGADNLVDKISDQHTSESP